MTSSMGADHPIVPVMIGDAERATTMADALCPANLSSLFISGCSKNKARIRVQLSAAHTKQHIDKAINAFLYGKRLLQGHRMKALSKQKPTSLSLVN